MERIIFFFFCFSLRIKGEFYVIDDDELEKKNICSDYDEDDRLFSVWLQSIARAIDREKFNAK